MNHQNVTMWVFTWQAGCGLRVEGSRTKREAKRLRGELLHNSAGPLVRVVLPIAASPSAAKGGA